MPRLAAALCLVVAVLDTAQMSLNGPSLGAAGGTVLYTSFAAGHLLRSRWAAVAAVVLPLLPVTLVTLWALGLSVPRTPDPWMLGILAVQLAAAGASLTRLRVQPPTRR